jgi:hypothetical protein
MPSHLAISLFLRLCSAYSTTTRQRKSAVLCWVPSSKYPPGNDVDNAAARVVAAHGKLSERFLITDIQTVLSDWQDKWPHEQDSNCKWAITREVTVACFRIRHTRVTQGHALRVERTPGCLRGRLPCSCLTPASQ